MFAYITISYGFVKLDGLSIPDKIAALSAIFNLNSAMFTAWGGLTQFFNYFSINLGNNARITEMLDVFSDLEEKKTEKNEISEPLVSHSINDDENKLEMIEENKENQEKVSLIEMDLLGDQKNENRYENDVTVVGENVVLKNLSIYTPNHNLLLSKLNLTSKKENVIVQGP